MNFWKQTALGAACILLGGSAAMAGCGIEAGSKVNILSNNFPAVNAVLGAAKACAGDGVTVTANATSAHQELQVPALTPNPAEYSAVLVANSSIVPLLNADLIRPLDDLVKDYGQQLTKSQLITVGGKVMAVAFDANAQHLYYRKDILEKAGIKEAPKTYEEVLAALEAIRKAGIMKYPWAMNTKTGWNLGEEFVNMYFGYGGTLFKPGSAEPNIDNEKGIAALKMLKALTAYSNPDFLTYDTQTSVALWQSGKLAMAELWGTSGDDMTNAAKSSKEIAENTVLTGAPTVAGGTTPASSLWWDGFVISKNISDKDAKASFIAMMHGISPEMMEANRKLAVWLIKGYQPAPTAVGVMDTVKEGAKPYPMVPYVSLLHITIGNGLSDYLQGKKSAKETLDDIQAAYVAAAKEKGFLK